MRNEILTQPAFARFASRKELANLGFHFLQLCVSDLSGGVEDHGLLDGEQAVAANETVHRETSAFKVGKNERNGVTIGARFSGNLTEHQIVTGKISHDERGTAFAGWKVGLWKLKNDHIPAFRFEQRRLGPMPALVGAFPPAGLWTAARIIGIVFE